MSNIIDNICKLRDVFSSKDYAKFPRYHRLMGEVIDETVKYMKRKTDDYKYTLDFTSQDLRELAEDVRKCLKRWDTALNPEKNIKSIKNEIKDGQLDLTPHLKRITPILEARRDNMPQITEFLSSMEHLGTYLYFLELASNDEFAIKHTERLF